MGEIFSIPAGTPFLDALARGVLDDTKADALALADTLILLPTRRAARALAEAFLRQSGGAALALPRVRALDEVDEDELAFMGESDAGGLDVPEAVSDLRRSLLLASIIQRSETDSEGRFRAPDQAVHLAAELGRLLDRLQTQDVPLDRLDRIVPDQYAEHWRLTLQLLEILGRHWPAILREEGAIDPAARRNVILGALAAEWRANPPAHRVIAAGSTGSIPVTAEVIAAVAGLPKGVVILPGLDKALDGESWAVLDATHPQFGLKLLLDRLGLERDRVRDWPGTAISPRAALIAEAMRPAATADAWGALTATFGHGALDGLSRLDCVGQAEEATAIALLLREKLEESGKTAALVTPDRTLARRVAAELRRWDIEVDDSGGEPLGGTPPGAFLRLVAQMVAEDFAPVPLLAALKHPLAACGMAPPEARERVRALEREALRGPRPAAGIPGLHAALGGKHERHGVLLDALGRRTRDFAALMGESAVPLADLVRAHVAAAESLAESDGEAGPSRLWAEEAGEAAARALAALLDAAGGFSLPGRDYPTLFEALIANHVVRPVHGRHPRLFIWGPLEARLQSADRVILGGLNETSWPRLPEADPWLSRPMQHSLGLPEPERRIGLAAHDFATLLAGREVILTRAERVEGSPTVPARWLLRLDAVLRRTGELLALRTAGRWGTPPAWHGGLDRPEMIANLPRPAPKPPLSARPRKLSVTRIGLWMRNPYAIYAREILKLKPLEDIDADPGAADRGRILHEVLHRFVSAHPRGLPPGALALLRAEGARVFDDAAVPPSVRALWWPRFEAVARWFVDVQARVARPTIATEVEGRLAITAPGGEFLLTARADRIDRSDGGLVLIDYKTGQPPGSGEVAAGYEPQLPLEAAMAAEGGFENVPKAPVVALEHWRLSGGAPPAEIKPVKDHEARQREALEGLAGLVAAFDDADKAYDAYPDMDRAPRFDDYAHLARVKEWSAGGGEP